MPHLVLCRLGVVCSSLQRFRLLTRPPTYGPEDSTTRPTAPILIISPRLVPAWAYHSRVLVALLCVVPVLGISLASDLCPVCIAPTFPRTEHHRVVVFSYLQVLRCICCLTQFCADWVWSVVLFTDFDFSNGRRLLDPKIPATRPSCPHLHHQLNAQYLAGLFSVSCIRSSTQKLRDYDVFQ